MPKCPPAPKGSAQSLVPNAPPVDPSLDRGATMHDLVRTPLRERGVRGGWKWEGADRVNSQRGGVLGVPTVYAE